MVSKPIFCKILENKSLNSDTYLMVLQCKTDWMKPGKFVNVKIPGVYLRRPLCVCDWNKNSITLIYKVVGLGTYNLSLMKKNEILDVLINLGNSYTIDLNTNKSVLIGGSVGFTSILPVAKILKQNKRPFVMIIGFKSKKDVCYINEIKKQYPQTIFCTDDGSFGLKGNVIEIGKQFNLLNHYYYCAGNTNMMKAVCHTFKEGQLSLETKMGCGFGACMGCSIQTKVGEKRICMDGPIFMSTQLNWH